MLSSPLAKLLRFLPLAALGVVLAGSTSTPPAQAAPTVESPFLWQVGGSENSSYLFGTIHAGVSAQELPVRVGRAIASSDLFIMETAPAKEMRGMGPHQPMDLDLANHAHRSGAKVLTLETLRFQLDLLSQLGNREEIAAMLAEDTAGNSAIEPLVEAYRSGDEELLAMATGPAEPAMQELLINSRNRRWAQKLSPVLARGGAFVAVGAGHMPGPQGLVSLLHNRGFSVERA